MNAFKKIAKLISHGHALESALNTVPFLEVYTVATLPSDVSEGQVIYVSDETGGATLAFSDGTNWRRVTDRAIVS